MLQALFIIAFIVIFFIVAALLDDRRRKSLVSWIEKHPNAKLHWGFDPAQCPQFPAVELARRLIGREPPRWAAAVETDEVWLAELSFTRNAGKTSKWHVMVARRQPDGTWQTELVQGLLTRSLLECKTN